MPTPEENKCCTRTFCPCMTTVAMFDLLALDANVLDREVMLIVDNTRNNENSRNADLLLYIIDNCIIFFLNIFCTFIITIFLKNTTNVVYHSSPNILYLIYHLYVHKWFMSIMYLCYYCIFRYSLQSHNSYLTKY